ncbi:hypothetical protein Barb4_01528 [Bacteroidales bacterium Barb4]|nr:hypothetical protein Barb4_01528 [Bacteroidales bacterium Barb4]
MVYNAIQFGRPCRTYLPTSSLTPHSATLHVGLKSLAPLGHLHNCFSTVKLDIVTFHLSVLKSLDKNARKIRNYWRHAVYTPVRGSLVYLL